MSHTAYRNIARSLPVLFSALATSLAAFGLAAAPAAAQTPLTWSDSGTNGTDPYGQGWQYNGVLGPGWGIPGVGAGSRPWSGPDQLLSFEVIFTDLPGGVSIQDPVATNTRMRNTSASVDWSAALLGPNDVLFTAPAGGELSPGTNFFANVLFNGGDPTGSAFTVNYNGGVAAAAPEGSTVALFGAGLPLLGCLVRGRRRK